MTVLKTLVLLTSAFLASGQRPSYAGFRPIGYPELQNKTTTASSLENKFGEGTTQRLPVEALGDRDLVDRLSKLPIDKQPFWFINWQALEANRQKPQTYPLKPNPFIDQNSNINSPSANTNEGSANVNPGIRQSPDTQSPNTQIQSEVSAENVNSEVNNRFGSENQAATDSKKTEPVNTDSTKLVDPINKENNAESNPNGLYSGKNVPRLEKDDEFLDIEVKKYVKSYRV